MNILSYITEPVDSLLDVGCNVGAWLGYCAQRYPSARLAGVEISRVAFEIAQTNVPSAELHHTGAEKLPFPDQTFQYITCVEVLEHVPSELRHVAFREMHRVLRPCGRLIMTVPHAGWFAWLDSNNMRLRFPGLYARMIGTGLRDVNYAAVDRAVEWHHHFKVAELERLAGPGWRRVAIRRGGLFIYPLMDWLSWPFYRLQRADHPLRRLFERIAGWDNQIDYGSASYGVLIAMERGE